MATSSDKKRKAAKIFALLGLVSLIALFMALDFNDLLTLENLKDQRARLERLYESDPIETIFVYFTVYILVVASSMPGAVVLTLAGGALFGLVGGTIVVSFASTIGAAFAFLISRFILRGYIDRKFASKLKIVNRGIKKSGGYYLLSLRLAPIFPFFLVNILMGLTSIRLRKFFIISQAGMLPGTIVYVFAGSQLFGVESPRDIMSPEVFFALLLLALLPLASKIATGAINSRKKLKKFAAPKKYDYNLAVIGAGAAGLTSAYLSSALKAKTALIEKDRMGGDCLNTGCVPSKALISSAKILSYRQNAADFGFKDIRADFSFEEIMERVSRTIKKIEPRDSAERYRKLGVDCYQGKAEILDPYRINVDGRVITSRNIVVASGASPIVAPIPGIDKINYLTSDTLWNLRHLPEKLTILGGGSIGCELAQSFARFGSKVVLIEAEPRILPREDREISELIARHFEKEGIRALTEHRGEKFLSANNKKILICRNRDGEETRIEFDEIILALGRKPNVTGFGLEKLGVELSADGTIKTDAYMASSFPNIFVCGDVAGPSQFTHAASHQAWSAAANALFKPLAKFRADRALIPRCVFCDPEAAGVGLTQMEAEARGVPYEVTLFDMAELDRAAIENEEDGFIKVLTKPGKDKILGVSIAGSRAGELIGQFTFAMQNGLGLNKIMKTVYPYPSFMEAGKLLAGSWRKNRASGGLLSLLKKFHAWRRGRGE